MEPATVHDRKSVNARDAAGRPEMQSAAVGRGPQHAGRPEPQQVPEEGETALSLLKRLMDELAVLFRQEVALAAAEVSEGVGRFAAGVLSILAGGAVLFAGVLVLLAAAVLALATVVSPWLAALIVGGAVTLVGLILVFAGKRASDPSVLKPERSPRSLRKDKSVLTRSDA